MDSAAAAERHLSNIDHHRALALAAQGQADEATLPAVRERCKRSAEAWQTIIDQMLATEHFALANQAAKQAA